MANDMCEILKTSHRIAVLGASPDPSRTSNDIARYLIGAGYEIVPVNPKYEQVHKLECYASLAEIPAPVDIVDVFRAAEHEQEVARDILAMKVKPRAVWFQLNAGGFDVREKLENASITVFVDQCIKVDHNQCR
ncbi:MAG: CoA-binding protein [Planctomycetes bacterium]|nr:CoA-binding protein [Planctomycetota bacterium]